MWYRAQFAADTNEREHPPDRGYEAKIIRAAAERAVRKLLRLKGKYNPSLREVDQKVNRIVDRLKERYRNLNNLRLHAKGERLSPLIEAVAKEIIT
jgi:membrane-anchored protein YejM (alkaline phosphatase superfamily)